MLPIFLYRGTKNLAASTDATGIEKLNTNAFQLDEYALPGRAKKLILLTKVAKIDIPTAHAGRLPPPDVNCPEVLFL
jgi:hypothetical protein